MQQPPSNPPQPGSVGTPTTPLPGTPIGNPGTMGNPLQGGPPQMQQGPPMQMQPPVMRPGQSMQHPDYCREKLVSHVYEFLVLHGASKAADSMKAELAPMFPNVKMEVQAQGGNGFLATWWSIFYDLYCAAPDRRGDEGVFASTEAKMFHDFGFVPSSFPMNGMPPQFGAPSPMMGPDGMMGGFAARGFGGRPGPMMAMGGFPPGAYMGGPVAQPRGGGRGAPGGAAAFPPMARGQPTPMGQMPPQGMYRGGFMDPSGGPPPFPSMGMHPNGGMPMCSSATGVMPGTMGSPGAMPPGPPMQMGAGADPRYMMMLPGSSAMPPFGGMGPSGMGGDVCPGGGPLPSAHTPLNGPGSNHGHSAGTPGSAGPMANLMNGSEMKHSPAGTPHGNGTPGPVNGPGSSGGGSVHSQGGVGTPANHGGPADITPKQEPMDTSHPPQEEEGEIAKIKRSLMDDFQKEAVSAGGEFFSS